MRIRPYATMGFRQGVTFWLNVHSPWRRVRRHLPHAAWCCRSPKSTCGCSSTCNCYRGRG